MSAEGGEQEDKSWKYLTVVESSLDSKVEYIGVGDRGHLGFLDGGYPTFRMEDENRDILLVTESIDSRTAPRKTIPVKIDVMARTERTRRTHLPVSPLVAPTTVSVSLSFPFLPSFLLFKKYSKRLPKNCKATSLKAKVGPCHNSKTYSLSPVWRRGAISGCRKVEYDREMSSARSCLGISEGSMKRE